MSLFSFMHSNSNSIMELFVYTHINFAASSKVWLNKLDLKYIYTHCFFFFDTKKMCEEDSHKMQEMNK